MRYIEREAALKLLKDRRNFLFKVWNENKDSPAANLHREALEDTEAVYWMIADMPDVEFDGAKTGRWVLKYEEKEKPHWECSVCGDRGGTWPGPPPFEYCPHCGSKMVFPGEEER